MSDPKQYPIDLNPMDLEPYYCRHISAMTAEGLRDKSAIAAQLAWRDKRIAELQAKLDAGPGMPWIPCSERIPDEERHDEFVLVFAPTRGVDMAMWRSQGYALTSEITHWMPLPKGPGK